MSQKRRDCIQQAALAGAGVLVAKSGSSAKAAAHTGAKVTFDEKSREIIANSKAFK